MQVALVTGSSRGLGRAIAERLARDGLAVAVNDRRGEGEPVAAAIREGGGASAAFTADVTDAQGVGAQRDGAAARSAARRGGLARPSRSARLLCQESGAPRPRGSCQGCAGWGRIVQVDSEVVDRPPPGRSAYAAAKAAQLGLPPAWARELAADGITVNTVAPGFVPVERHTDVSDSERDAYIASVPAGRFGTPAEIAHAVSFFATEQAAFVTGQRLVVDGGRSLA
jgi:3-oxoacyl-[acyl-carrier protein] reductase